LSLTFLNVMESNRAIDSCLPGFTIQINVNPLIIYPSITYDTEIKKIV